MAERTRRDVLNQRLGRGTVGPTPGERRNRLRRGHQTRWGVEIPGIDFHGYTRGRCCDTSQGVYETTDGQSYSKVGISGASGAFYDIASVNGEDANVVAGGGLIYRSDGNRWTPLVVGTSAIRAVDRDGEFGLTAGSGGIVYERQTIGDWEAIVTPTTKKLMGVARDSVDVDVAVGGNGRIIDRTASVPVSGVAESLGLDDPARELEDAVDDPKSKDAKQLRKAIDEEIKDDRKALT